MSLRFEEPETIEPEEQPKIGNDTIETSYDLKHREFPPIRWIVAGIIPAGFTLLAGKPKVARKSWTALNLAMAVATGGRALGFLAVERGTVLYLDLDPGNMRRMKNRMEKIAPTDEWPRNIFIANSWPAGDAGVNQLDDWLTMQDDTVLVIIDILINLRPTKSSGDVYQDDSLFLQGLSRLSGQHNVAIVAIHHVRKLKDTSDIFQDIYGGVGVQGAVDNMLVIEHNPTGAMLHVRGRDIEDDRSRTIRWDNTIFSWVLSDQVEIGGGTRQRIAVLLADAGEDLTLSQICDYLPDLNISTVQSTLQRMVKDAQIEKRGRGIYRIFDPEHALATDACLSA